MGQWGGGREGGGREGGIKEGVGISNKQNPRAVMKGTLTDSDEL